MAWSTSALRAFRSPSRADMPSATEVSPRSCLVAVLSTSAAQLRTCWRAMARCCARTRTARAAWTISAATARSRSAAWSASAHWSAAASGGAGAAPKRQNPRCRAQQGGCGWLSAPSRACAVPRTSRTAGRVSVLRVCWSRRSRISSGRWPGPRPEHWLRRPARRGSRAPLPAGSAAPRRRGRAGARSGAGCRARRESSAIPGRRWRA